MDHASAAPFGHLSAQQKAFTLIGTLLGMFLAALDQTVVATAGPAIQQSLHIEASLYVWITTSYLVASTVLVPIYGKLSDLFGRRRILMVSIIIFLLGSLLCGLSQTTLQLIAFRAVQGCGSAGLFTTAFAVIADIFTPVERGKYQGIFGAVFGISSVVGPLVGGFITDTWGWHWVFFVNLPIGAVAMIFILSKMPSLKRDRQGPRPPIDLPGALALTVFVVPLLVALSLGKTAGDRRPTGYLWGSWEIIGLFAVAAVGLIAFLLIERRAHDPILDLRLFRSRIFALNTLAAFIIGGAFLAAIVFLPLFMVNVVGLSATSSGLTTTPLTMGLVAGNITVGQVVSRIGRYKILLVVSQIILLISFVVMGFTLTSHSSQAEVTLKMILVGIGLGPSIPLFTLAIQSAVEPRLIGVATSTATFSRQMGSTVGLAVIGTIFATVLATQLPERMAPVIDRAPAELQPMARQFMDRAATGGGGGAGAGEEGGGRSVAMIDRDRMERGILGYFSGMQGRLAAQLQGVPRDDPRWAQVAKFDQYKAYVPTFVDQAVEAMKDAFTEAVRRIYQVAILIVLLGFVVTLIAPEVPLRRGPPGAAPPPALE